MVNLTLALAVQSVMDRPEYAGCRWGVSARRRGTNLSDVALVYENPHGAALFMTPASNNKLPTAYAAWLQLGPAYTFDTVLGVAASADSSPTNFNVTLCGAGDPSLSSAQLASAAVQAVAANPGLASAAAAYVTVRVDDRRSGPEPFPGSWEQGDLAYGYGAAPTAVVLDANTVTVRVGPGAQPGDPVTARVLEPGGDQCFTVSTTAAATVATGAAGGVVPRLEVRSAQLLLSVAGSLAAGGSSVDLNVACRDPLRRAGIALVSALLAAGS